MPERPTGTPRLLRSAVATSTLPLLVLGSAALAAPAAADAPRQALAPRSATSVNIETAQVRLSSTTLASSLPAAFVAPTGATQASRTAATHTVKAGDTLYGIATRHGISLSTLLKANGLSSAAIIHPGQTLKLSGTAGQQSSTSRASAGTYTVKAGDTLSGIATRNGIGLSTLLKANGLSSAAIIHPGQTLKLSGAAGQQSSTSRASAGTYTVKAGDTLSGIATRNGIGLSTLLKANGLSSAAIIHPGQTLKLSSAAGQGAAPGNDLVPSTFLHYTYPDHVVSSANANKRALLGAGVPSRSQMQAIIADTARRMGVDPSLALAHSFAESSFNHAAVSPANAIGAMQVIPSSGTWASELVGRKLNLLDPYDNATAGVAIIRQLQRNAPSVDIGIAAYYQGLGGVTRNGMYPDTKRYVSKVKGYMQRF
ncbi:lytic transglycosylase domain-containing protein [Micrococcus sp. TA1]|uniref:lytic transglycosylase domain-containing protein n=1 Tax=Micrococcus sp. TA1 TaxID=681627 RepID=UPI001609551E|nr:lytic transglycosylase domain-containing protein [Micrococcus sp. TA1]MBB5749202.1 LysM repeat protein [Micrococcus sp. TA1]